MPAPEGTVKEPNIVRHIQIPWHHTEHLQPCTVELNLFKTKAFITKSV